MASYFAVFMPVKEGGYAVEFPDFPEAFTQAGTFEECLVMGSDILAITVEEYIKARKDMPEPSTLQQVEEWAANEQGNADLDPSRRRLIQLFRAPDVDATPVRVSVSFTKSMLDEIDSKAKAAGYTRSGFLAQAAQTYQNRQ